VFFGYGVPTDAATIRLERARIGRDEVEGVAECWRSPDVRRPGVQRHGDEKVERHLAAVVRHQAASNAVDLPRVELGDEIDPFRREQRTEML